VQPLDRGLVDRGRPRKRWRYVGIFGEQLLACAAAVQIGPLRQTFWALHLPGTEQGLAVAGGSTPARAAVNRERTRLLPRRGELQLLDGAALGAAGTGLLVLRDRGVFLDLVLAEDAGVQARCPHGRGEVWTRKQAGIAVQGTLSLDGGAAEPIAARAVIDDTLGYHARETEWRWSAGVGETPDGVPVAWNLVEGVNDPAQGSERAVWQDGVPAEAPPVRFATDLSSIRCEDGSELSFTAAAERSRHDNFLLLASDYRAPFGSFAGTLPGGVELARGRGVMEHHRARW
jgi:hypothetical protein